MTGIIGIVVAAIVVIAVVGAIAVLIVSRAARSVSAAERLARERSALRLTAAPSPRSSFGIVNGAAESYATPAFFSGGGIDFGGGCADRYFSYSDFRTAGSDSDAAAISDGGSVDCVDVGATDAYAPVDGQNFCTLAQR